MEKNQSVFIKQKITYKASKEAILNSIPGERLDKPDPEKAKDMVEWRCRILNINDSEFIEVSQKAPGKSRLYINDQCEWVERNIPSEFDKYVQQTIYTYLEKGIIDKSSSSKDQVPSIV